MKKINIMLSSRCYTLLKKSDGTTEDLTKLRKRIKKEIEEAQILGKNLFEVFINEDHDTATLSNNSWDECLKAVEECNILISIYTGEGGWGKAKSDIGICHAELSNAIENEPGKAYLINAKEAVHTKKDESKLKEQNDLMDKYVSNLNRFHSNATTAEEIEDKIKSIVIEASIKLTHLGQREVRRGKYNTGEALNWSRLNYISRSKEMIKIIRENFIKDGNTLLNDTDIIFNEHETNKNILFRIHAIPDAMSVSTAREIVGRPFLQDHLIIKNQPQQILGPFHIILIHKNITDTQVANFLGHPDATIVSSPFGIYLADNIQKIQCIFLKDCRDKTSTTHNYQRFRDWIYETNETSEIINRAEGRRQILNSIIKANT